MKFRNLLGTYYIQSSKYQGTLQDIKGIPCKSFAERSRQSKKNLPCASHLEIEKKGNSEECNSA